VIQDERLVDAFDDFRQAATPAVLEWTQNMAKAAVYYASRGVGPENDAWILRETAAPLPVIAAWGANAKFFPARVRAVTELIRRPLVALDVTGDGHPSHPLMLSYNIGNHPRMPQPWSLSR
jgi:hypothetical protein